MIQAVFFDLDGTFADTAPDLARALNHMRTARRLDPVPVAVTRPVTSVGTRGLLGVGFGLTPEHGDYRAMREEFLALYERDICRETRVFPGMLDLVAALEARGVHWGIVTNKTAHLARLLLGELGVASRTACIIGGDSTPHLKPHPAPVLAACRATGLEPGTCIYVGDDQRDIEAGQAAGTKTAAARWGYLNGGEPERWGADWTIAQPQDLLPLL
jgi:phosphoglycolate phosphatase